MSRERHESTLFALDLAIKKAGGLTALGGKIGVTKQAINRMQTTGLVSPRLAKIIEKEFGVSKVDLCPDIFGE